MNVPWWVMRIDLVGHILILPINRTWCVFFKALDRVEQIAFSVNIKDCPKHIHNKTQLTNKKKKIVIQCDNDRAPDAKGAPHH